MVKPVDFLERNEDAKLLTATYVRELRLHHLLSVDALAEHIGGTGRTSTWLRSFERGEIMPTRRILASISTGFDSACSVAPGYELEQTYQDLLDDPTSDLADRLRKRSMAPSAHATEDKAEPIEGINIYSAGLSEEDRILVLFPIALFLSLLALIALAVNHAVDGALPAINPWAVSLIAAFLASAVVTMVIGLNHMVSILCWPIHRIAGWTGKHADPSTWAELSGVTIRKGVGWYKPAFLPHLIPDYKLAFRENSIAADFAERICMVFLCGALVATWAFIDLDLFDDPLNLSVRLNAYGPGTWLGVLTAISWLFTATSCYAAFNKGRAAHSSLFHGLGLVQKSTQATLDSSIAPAVEEASSASSSLPSASALAGEATQAPSHLAVVYVHRQLGKLPLGRAWRRVHQAMLRPTTRKHA